MKNVLVTGSAGLIGSECVEFFINKGFNVVGIDNDMRSFFFGENASTAWNLEKIKNRFGDSYCHHDVDIRTREDVNDIFDIYGSDIECVIHTAAQPSHDYPASARDGAVTDFTINALGTLFLLEAAKTYCPNAVFIFTSTNKVYGDLPNFLPLEEKDTRWELKSDHKWYDGIDESMSIDNSKHSIFGASKVAADVMVQEYGKYFGMKTGVFRGGCLFGQSHSGARLHGFLSYLIKCIIKKEKYTIYGYKGKQVRDNIHSHDVASAFWEFYKNPKCGEAYNIGGTRFSNCSVLEAIAKIEEISERKGIIEHSDNARVGDHQWYISSMQKFKDHYPNWEHKISLDKMISFAVESETKK